MTVQSYAGQLTWGLTACRAMLPQEESYEIIGYLQDALEEIKAFPTVAVEATARPD